MGRASGGARHPGRLRGTPSWPLRGAIVMHAIRGRISVMKPCRRTVSVAAVLVLCVTVASAVRADEGAESATGPNRYIVTTLTADLPGIAPNTDPVLQNAWGVAFTPGASPFWISDN